MHKSTDERIFELQVFGGKEYATVASGKLSDLEIEFMSLAGKTRRIVLPGKHPARPRYRSPRYSGASASKDAVIDAYLQWAAQAGLECVHVYEGQFVRPRTGIEYIPVPVADFLGPVMEDEPEVMAA